MDALAGLGDVGVFGGLMRDAAMQTPGRFRSDVDLVVETEWEEDLAEACAAYKPRRNRFGGFRLALSGASVDIWPLKKTWAIAQGHAKGQSLRDLVGTTYFSWDSIVYSWRTGTLYFGEDYFAAIERRVIDLVLAENPNPLGALVRTMRYALGKQAAVGRALAEHTAQLAVQFRAEDMIAAERKGFPTPVLTPRYVEDFQQRLREYVRGGAVESAFKMPEPFQLELPLTRLLG